MTTRWVVSAVAAAILAGACAQDMTGPSPTDPVPAAVTTQPATTTTLATETAVRVFEECLADQDIAIEPIPMDDAGRPRVEVVMSGVDLTEPGAMEALTDCSRHLTGGALDLSGEPLLRASVIGLLQEFSECVRSLGVTEFPDPLPGFTGVGAPYPADEIPYDDPALTAAAEACGSALVEGEG